MKIKCVLCEYENIPCEFTKHLKKEHNITSEQYYNKFLKIDENEGKCLHCCKYTKFLSILRKYALFCSINCLNKSEYRKIKNLEAKNSFTDEKKKEIKQKYKKTCLERYGKTNFNLFGSDEFKQNMTKKYGDNYQNINRQKAKETCLERYGKTNLNLFGSDEFKQNMTKKYDVEFYSQSEMYKEKSLKTIREKRYNSFLKELSDLYYLPLFTENEFKTSNELKYKCLLCNNIITSKRSQSIYAFTCICRNTKSIQEIKMYEFLKSNIPNIKIQKNKKIIFPLELDIYLPDYNLAIEFDGLYWHSDLFKDKNYHLNKTNLCNEQNIQLLHIFENEWILKQDIVKSIILAKLGKFSQRIMARKCKIKEISNIEYKNFCIQNHLQGWVPAKYKVGLFYNDELVQICSFGQSRYKKGEIELLRHCSKLNTQIIGGLSKLLSFYHFDNLVTYVDLRYGTGKRL